MGIPVLLLAVNAAAMHTLRNWGQWAYDNAFKTATQRRQERQDAVLNQVALQQQMCKAQVAIGYRANLERREAGFRRAARDRPPPHYVPVENARTRRNRGQRVAQAEAKGKVEGVLPHRPPLCNNPRWVNPGRLV